MWRHSKLLAACDGHRRGWLGLRWTCGGATSLGTFGRGRRHVSRVRHTSVHTKRALRSRASTSNAGASAWHCGCLTRSCRRALRRGMGWSGRVGLDRQRTRCACQIRRSHCLHVLRNHLAQACRNCCRFWARQWKRRGCEVGHAYGFGCCCGVGMRLVPGSRGNNSRCSHVVGNA